MNKDSRKCRAVDVEWIDSMNTGGWSEHKKSDLRCRSVGLLIEKTKDRIVIAQNASAYTAGNYTEIPLFAVKRLRRLK